MNRVISAGIALVVALSATALPAHAERVPLSTLDQQTHYHGIAVDPADPSRLYLATHHGFYLVYPDGTAERISPVQDFMGFTPHPTDPSILYASGHPSGGGNLGFLLSADGGTNWTQVSAGLNGPVDFHQMDVSPADPQVIYGSYGGIQVSRDGGKTWQMAGPAPEGLISLAASSQDANRIYAATKTGLLVSDDAGATWRKAAHEGQIVTMVTTGPEGVLYAYVVGRGLMMAKEGDPNVWSTIGEAASPVLLHLAIDGREPQRMFAIAHKAGVLASEDGGKSWHAFGQQ
jgi:photosystem II stability/assembly factor-like uncharacterized protein